MQNIIFDLGGVIYEIRYLNIADKFKSYGLDNFDKIYTKQNQTDTIDLYEEGKIPTSELRSYIRSLSNIELTDKQIDDAWNAILIDVSEDKVEMLKKVRNNYRTFLFSNTNELNYNCFSNHLNNKFGFNFFDTLFERAYFSHILKDRKPKKSAFIKIIEEQNLVPSETLFIDDCPQHIESAKKLGLNCYHVKHHTDVLKLFDNNGKLVI